LMQERAVQTSIQERYHEDSDTLLQLSGTEYGQSCLASASVMHQVTILVALCS